MHKRIIFLIFIFIYVTPIVFANTLSEYQKQLNKIEQEKKKTEKQINAIISKKHDISNQIDTIDRKIYDYSNNINKLENNIKTNQKMIEKLTNELNIQEKKRMEYYNLVKDRLCAMYETNNLTYLDIILSSKSISDFFSRGALIKDILEYDNRILEEYLNIIKDIKAKKNNLIAVSQLLQKEKAELESEKKELQIQQENKKMLLSQLESQQDKLEQMLDEMEEISQEISKKIKQILAQQKTKRKYVGGKLAWPLEAEYPITSYFGMRFHPILKKTKMHTGIDIGAPYGSNILAAADGEVITAEWVPAYGLTVIIDNGSGIVTLYAHMSKILVHKGQVVKRNNVIGRVGSTGYSTGPHLHFEVRINGDVVNPLSYLK